MSPRLQLESNFICNKENIGLFLQISCRNMVVCLSIVEREFLVAFNFIVAHAIGPNAGMMTYPEFVNDIPPPR